VPNANGGAGDRLPPAANRSIATRRDKGIGSVEGEIIDAVFMPQVETCSPVLSGTGDEIAVRSQSTTSINAFAECCGYVVIVDFCQDAIRRSSRDVIDTHHTIITHQTEELVSLVHRQGVNGKAKLVIEYRASRHEIKNSRAALLGATC
jgi:hypothetical protein